MKKANLKLRETGLPNSKWRWKMQRGKGRSAYNKHVEHLRLLTCLQKHIKRSKDQKLHKKIYASWVRDFISYCRVIYIWLMKVNFFSILENNPPFWHGCNFIATYITPPQVDSVDRALAFWLSQLLIYAILIIISLVIHPQACSCPVVAHFGQNLTNGSWVTNGVKCFYLEIGCRSSWGPNNHVLYLHHLWYLVSHMY